MKLGAYLKEKAEAPIQNLIGLRAQQPMFLSLRSQRTRCPQSMGRVTPTPAERTATHSCPQLETMNVVAMSVPDFRGDDTIFLI